MGRDLWESIWSNCPAEAGPLAPSWRDHVQTAFEYFQKGSAVFLGNLCRCSVTLTAKNCFQMFRQKMLCFTLCPLPPILGHWTGPGSGCSLHPPFCCFCTLVRGPWDLQDEPSQLSQLRREMLLNHLSDPFFRLSLVLGCPKLDPEFQVWIHKMKVTWNSYEAFNHPCMKLSMTICR